MKAITVLFGLMIVTLGLFADGWHIKGLIALFGSYFVIYGLRDVPAVRRRFPDFFQRIGSKRSEP
ncbi:hypothetical protein [Pseudomonas pseudonitroreducens]|uniref:hypothetical protein n=1 Tax=Pseudomonas pseudonitroreducens TaxID=2892326 RepID=UPI001F3B7039|nr:hypothetical protein [Pseudomonas pseudonitroreducens]